MVKLSRFRSKVKDEGEVDVDSVSVISKNSRTTRKKKFWARNRKAKTADAEDPPEESARDEGNEIRDDAPEDNPDARRGSFKERMFGKGEEKDNANIAVAYDEFGESASNVMNLVMRHESLQNPTPKDSTDVVIKVEASSVSLQDCIIRRGMWYESVELPTTPGFDVVGVIDKMGDKVKEEGTFKEGNIVAALVKTGGNARFITIPSTSLVKVPTEIDSAVAASVVTTYMTAFQALNVGRGSKNEREELRGKKILVTGGSGTVGSAIIQLARWAGAESIYATAHERDHKSLEARGAIPLPFSHEKWLPKVKGHMDIVIDGICVDGLASPQAALNDNGRLVCIGMTSQLYSSKPGLFGIPASAIWTSVKANCFMSRTTTFDLWESFQSEPELFKSDLAFLFDLVKSGAITPTVSKKIPLSEVADAHEQIERGQAPGQLVCLPWKRFEYKRTEDNEAGRSNEATKQ